MASLHLNDDPEAGTHRAFETERLLPKVSADQQNAPTEPNSMFPFLVHFANTACFIGVVVYFAVAFTVSSALDDAEVCRYGGKQFPNPWSYFVTAETSVLAALSLVAVLV